MLILDINKSGTVWDVIGFVDDNMALKGKDVHGINVLGGREIFQKYADAKVLAVPGNPSQYLQRKQMIEQLGVAPDRFATVIHSSVFLSADASVGCNSLVMPNVVLNEGASIAAHCVILPNTVISHDSSVGAYGCVGSNVSISGSVVIDEQCYIGSGTSIKDQVSIGARSHVGIGSNVLSSVPAGEVWAGNPARFLRKVEN
jgi:sugar O-acyltransferase (sialic acid O-acetyltransferase NeuD family)